MKFPDKAQDSGSNDRKATDSPHNSFQRWISRLLIVTITAMTLQPLTAAAQARAASAALHSQNEQRDHRDHSAIEQADDIVKQVLPHAWGQRVGKRALRASNATDGNATASDDDLAQAAQKLLQANSAIEAEADAIEAEFSAIEDDLIAKNLPPEILQRHRQTVADFKTRRTEYIGHLQSVDKAVGGKRSFLARALRMQPSADNPPALRGAMGELASFLAKHPNKKQHTPSDPTNLPWGTPKSQTREPIESAIGYKLSRLFPHDTVKLAQAGSMAGIALPTPAGPTPTAADLSETEDVQLTPAIKAQATALNNNPVKIHHWVKNSIEFIPSYGSIQGADLTLQTKRGNAFDTASLEIALLRAAHIPARYVYGTIQLPIEQAKNWVGGVTTPGAAQSLLGQGGIPNVALINGGQVSHIKLEHVWVEAWIDYIPSRGAKHIEGDTWVPLDASFKQYQYKAGIDLKTQVPLDAQALLDQAKQGATVNETEGWVQNLNQTGLNQSLTDYQTRIKTYLDQNNPNASVGDVLGTKTIQAENRSIVMGSLPYKTIATGSRFASMPANLQWKFRTTLADAGIDPLGDPMGNTLASLNQSTATLAGKKITISFTPATQADIDLLNSYLPKPHADGTPIQPSELPTSLPGYLLKLKAEIRLDGQVVSQSTVTATMGQTLTQATAYFNPGTQAWEEAEPNKPIAGDYHAIGLDLQGTSQAQLTALKTKLEATKAKLEAFQANPSDTTPIKDMTKEDLGGDLLYSGILGYFASVDGSDQLTARTRGDIVNYRAPSFGAFFAGAQPHYFFGIVRSVSFPGVIMDVDRVMYQAEAKDEDKAKKLAYVRQVGSFGSVTEHVVPEGFLVDKGTCNFPDTVSPDPAKPECAQGISAVKALAVAASQGQRIYTLNQASLAYHASIVQGLGTDADTKAEISNALAAGKEVTVHQADITVSGWTGIGYIILDPESGAGAYKISGGANGSWMVIGAVASFALGPIGLVLGGFSFAVVAGSLVMAVVGMKLFLKKLIEISNDPNLTAEEKRSLTELTAFVGIFINMLSFSAGYNSKAFWSVLMHLSVMLYTKLIDFFVWAVTTLRHEKSDTGG